MNKALASNLQGPANIAGRVMVVDDHRQARESVSDILRHATVLDVASLEDPKIQDTLDRAQHDTALAFSTIVNNLQSALADVIQIIFTAAIIAYLEPLVLLVICPLAVPYLLYRWRLAKSRYAEEVVWTTKRRWMSEAASRSTVREIVSRNVWGGLTPALPGG